MSLREVQRRAGVSAAAAYRHYRDRRELLLAVGRRASAAFADRLEAAVDGTSADGPDADGPAERLRRGCRAYWQFAQDEPHMFRAVFLTAERPEELASPDRESAGRSGRRPYQILQDCLVAITPSQDPATTWTDTAIWSATHGFALLNLDGPLQHLSQQDRAAAGDRLLDLLLAGLTAEPAPRRQRSGSGPAG